MLEYELRERGELPADGVRRIARQHLEAISQGRLVGRNKEPAAAGHKDYLRS